MPTTEPAFVLPDLNVLVALTNPSHQHHVVAHDWLRTVERFATTPITEVGLTRLLLNPAVVGQPVARAAALGIVSAIAADPRCVFLPDDTRLHVAAIDVIGLVGHQQVTDFHLVSLAARHGGVLATFDRRIAAALAAPDRARVHTIL